MLKVGFSVYDFTVNSLRKTLDHVRSMVLATLTFIGGLVVAGLCSMMIVSPIILKLRHLIPTLKQTMPVIGSVADKAARMKVMSDTWHNVVPLLTTLDFVLITLSALFFLIFIFGLVLGFLRMTLDLVDRNESPITRMLSCFGMAPRFLIASLLSAIVILVGFALFIVPGIFFMVRLRLFPYYIIDKKMGALESLKASFRATQGYEWEILGLHIVAGVLSAVAPVIGIPVTCFMLAYVYRALVQR
jgi:hypothetical protein